LQHLTHVITISAVVIDKQSKLTFHKCSYNTLFRVDMPRIIRYALVRICCVYTDVGCCIRQEKEQSLTAHLQEANCLRIEDSKEQHSRHREKKIFLTPTFLQTLLSRGPEIRTPMHHGRVNKHQ
jgi:hypothetical protein